MIRRLTEFLPDDKVAEFRARALPVYFSLPRRLRYAIRSARGASTVYLKEESHLGVVFIHVPKNGGSAINKAIFRNSKAKYEHYPADFYRWESPSLYESLTSFAVVRDPLDRLLSVYRYFKTLPDDVTETTRLWAARNIEPLTSFDDMVQNWLTRSRRFSWLHFMPQSYFVTDNSGSLIVDQLLRFENLAEDFAGFADQYLGCEIPSLERVNVSRHKTGKTISKVTVNKVRDIYAEDYELISNVGRNA